jgi:class 3 adenylate cyclase
MRPKPLWPNKSPSVLAPRPETPNHLAQKILSSRSALEGERKTITALFADIKSSMELIEGVDPEEARRIVDPALQLMIDAVHRYEGYVAQSTGDGIFALFGAPIAHEDHAQRALYAALRMQEGIKKYADELRRRSTAGGSWSWLERGGASPSWRESSSRRRIASATG